MLTLKQSRWQVVLPSKYRWLMWHGRCNVYIMCVCLFICMYHSNLSLFIYLHLGYGKTLYKLCAFTQCTLFFLSHYQPTCKTFEKLQRMWIHDTTWLQGTCISKLPPQGNEDKYVAQKMKTTRNCECMLYKCFKSKWKICYCIDKNIDISNINILRILQGHKK